MPIQLPREIPELNVKKSIKVYFDFNAVDRSGESPKLNDPGAERLAQVASTSVPAPPPPPPPTVNGKKLTKKERKAVSKSTHVCAWLYRLP